MCISGENPFDVTLSFNTFNMNEKIYCMTPDRVAIDIKLTAKKIYSPLQKSIPQHDVYLQPQHSKFMQI